MINIAILIIALILAILLVVGKKPVWYLNRAKEITHMIYNRARIAVRSIYLEYIYKGDKVYYLEFTLTPNHPDYIPDDKHLNQRSIRTVAPSKKVIVEQFKNLDADLTYIEISIEQDVHRASN